MPTMRDVARLAGVSAKTVSRVVNRDRYVSAHVRTRVERAVDELHYRPNLLAVTFRNGRDAAIGVTVPGVADPFFASIIGAVEAEASSRGVAVIVTSVGWEPSHEQRSIEAVLQRQVAGMIIVPVGPDMSYLRPWQDRTPLVFADRVPGRLTADVVVQDDAGGSRRAVAHLVQHGHRRIAFMGDGDQVPTALLRLRGYEQALADDGLPTDDDLVHLGDLDTPALTARLRRMLALADPPTALFSSNARCTIGLVPALQALRRTDVGLVGFGDFPMASALRPAVSVVDQDGAAMGRFAAERLFTRLEQPDRRLRRRTVLPVRLVTRTSCGLRGERLRPGHGDEHVSIGGAGAEDRPAARAVGA